MVELIKIGTENTVEKHIQENIKVRSDKVMLAEEIIQNEVQLFSKINKSEK